MIVALTSSAFTTGMLAMLLFAGKSLIERWLARSLEKFKVDLQLAAFEHETKFTGFHEKRAEVIAELYKRLVQLQISVSALVSTVEETKECESSPFEPNYKKAFQSVLPFKQYFEENRLYLAKDLCDRLEEFWGVATAALLVVTASEIRAPLDSVPLPPRFREMIEFGRNPDAVQGLIEAVNDQLPQIRREIEINFCAMLIDNPDQS